MNDLSRLPAVMNATALSRATVYLRVKQGLLTAPIKLGERAVAWPSDEIAAVNGARIAGHNDDEIRALVVRLTALRREAAIA